MAFMNEDGSECVDVIISSFREAMHLAPVIHSLRDDFIKRVRVITFPALERNLELLINQLDLSSDIQWRVFCKTDDPCLIFGEIQLLLSELWSTKRPSCFLFFGHDPIAFSCIASAFQNNIPAAHIIDANRDLTLETRNQHDFQIRRSINAMTDIHFTPNIQIRNNLIVQGIKEKNVYTVGSTLPDASLFLTRRIFLNRQLDELSLQHLNKIFDTFDPKKTILIEINDVENFKKMPPHFVADILNTFRSYRVILLESARGNNQINKAQFSAGQVVYLTEPNLLHKCFLLNRVCCAISDSVETLEQGMAFGVRGMLLRSATERFDLVCSGWVTLLEEPDTYLLERFRSEINHSRDRNMDGLSSRQHISQLTSCAHKIAQAVTTRTNENAEKLKTSLQPQQGQ